MVKNIHSKKENGEIRVKRAMPGLAAVLSFLLSTAFGAAGQGAGLSITALTIAAQAAGQTSPLPQAESILEAYVAKCGGQALLDKIVNRRTISTMTLSLLPASAEVRTIVTKAGPYRCIVNSPSFGKIEYGSDGGTVWEINPMTGPQIKEGLERRRFQALYSLDLALRWREAFQRVECTGLAEVGGRPAFKLTAVTSDDYAITYYFDQTSGLLAKVEYPMETVTGQSLQEVFLDDYRSVAGTLFPYRQVRKEPGRQMTLIFTSVEFNVEVPEGTFDLPEAILKTSKLAK